MKKMDFLNRTWSEISLDNIENNFNIIKGLCPDTKILCVVKADGYGHGAVQVAKLLDGKADYFAVSNIEEGVELRRADVSSPILILGYTPVKFAKELSDYSLTQTLLSYDYATKLNDFAKENGVTVRCHIKIDTGMNRIGFEYDDERLYEVCEKSNLDVEGIFTHFASADKDGDKDGSFTKMQFDRLMTAINSVESRGYKFKIRHCCNSAATIANPEYRLDMVRAGIILYGLEPSEDIPIDKFKPAMSLKSTVAMIKNVKKGEQISYGRTYTADCDRRIATLPVGYADGYQRAFAKCKVMINGVAANVVGRICMDQCMIDVTDIDAKEGDTVTLFGYADDKILPVENLAGAANTINYEIVCLLSKRVGKIYIHNGKIVEKNGLLNR